MLLERMLKSDWLRHDADDRARSVVRSRVVLPVSGARIGAGGSSSAVCNRWSSLPNCWRSGLGGCVIPVDARLTAFEVENLTRAASHGSLS
jgi:hypothetical protein